MNVCNLSERVIIRMTLAGIAVKPLSALLLLLILCKELSVFDATEALFVLEKYSCVHLAALRYAMLAWYGIPPGSS